MSLEFSAYPPNACFLLAMIRTSTEKSRQASEVKSVLLSRIDGGKGCCTVDTALIRCRHLSVAFQNLNSGCTPISHRGRACVPVFTANHRRLAPNH
jgi:hypothetical protein